MNGTTLTNKEWEDICDGCGKCCGLTRPRDGTGTACPGLNVKTNRCTVYADRQSHYICLQVTPDNTLTLHEQGILPDSCAYVRYALKQPPLDRPVPTATLTPFALAPLSFRRRYNKANKRWLKARSTTCTG